MLLLITILFYGGPGCNIGAKTLLAKWGKLALKIACPASTSTCLATLFNKGELHREKSGQNILAEQGKLGSCSVCPIAVFCWIHLQIWTGQVVMLHAEAIDLF